MDRKVGRSEPAAPVGRGVPPALRRNAGEVLCKRPALRLSDGAARFEPIGSVQNWPPTGMSQPPVPANMVLGEIIELPVPANGPGENAIELSGTTCHAAWAVPAEAPAEAPAPRDGPGEPTPRASAPVSLGPVFLP